MTTKVKWRDTVQRHDFPAAACYLDLLTDTDTISLILDRLEQGNIVQRKAKDILRASQLPLLPYTNSHVASDVRKIKDGEELSPILAVRGDLLIGVPLQIADGYHRVCAAYHTDENTSIPVVIVDAWEPVTADV